MLIVVQQGGIAPGGNNFDCKLRRESTDIEDMFIAHIGGTVRMHTFQGRSCLHQGIELMPGMDCLARGLIGACKLVQENLMQKALDTRQWKSWRNMRE